MAHELNQPLMAAGTYTRLVDDAMGHKSGGPRRALRADGTEEVIETTGDGDSLSDFVE